MTSSPTRNLVRMRALPPAELPAHPSLSSLQPAPPDLTTFLQTALSEAATFMTNYLPLNFKVKSGAKPSPPSTATVELLAHEVPVSELPAGTQNPETWFARTSVHDNAAQTGTASWSEFDNGLRLKHSLNERDYTPDVYEAHCALDWAGELAKVGGTVGEWEQVEMKVMEMVHSIPTPLNDRVFAELVITAVRKGREEFVVVQIPVDTREVKDAKYPNGSEGKGKTSGMYCSVERGEVVEGGKRVKWQMGTASDAGGSLPMCLQKLGVPGAVVKDVGLFLGWCAEQRK
nr:hypothetical protein CFP56_79357 [Quercus suber]